MSLRSTLAGWARGWARVLEPSRARRLLPPTDASLASEFGIFGTGFGLDDEEFGHGRAFEVISSVYRGVDMIKGDVASLPLLVYRLKRSGIREIATDHPFLAAWDRANDRDTGSDIVEGIQGSLDLNGNAFLHREALGGPLEFDFETLPAHLMGPRFNKAGKIVRWVLRLPSREPREYDPEEIIHFRYWNWKHEWAGLAPLSAASLSYRTQRLEQRWAYQIYLRGGEVPYALEGDYNTDEPKRRRQELLMRRRYARGPEGTQTPNIHPPGMKRVVTGLSPKELLAIEQYKLTKADVYEVLGIPPWMVGIKESGGLGQGEGSKTDERLYWRNTIQRRAVRIARTLTEFLLPDWGDDLVVEFDFSDVHPLKLERLELAEKGKAVTGRPVVTVNEFRTEYLGLEPFEGEEFDEPYDPFAGGLLGEDSPTGAGAEPGAAAEGTQQETRAAVRRAHLVRLTRFERGFHRVVVRLFDQQEERVLAQPGVRDRRDYTGDDFAESEQDYELVTAALRRIIELRGAEALTEVLADADFEMGNAAIARHLERQTDRMLTGTSETTRTDLRKRIAEAKANGEHDVTAVVRAVFDDRRENAALIARTEVSPAYNFATDEAWKQSGEVEGEEWVTILDGHEREAHHDADGQVVPIGQPFMVGGEALSFPGDPVGSPRNVIGCRCGMRAVLVAARTRLLTGRGAHTVSSLNGNGKPSNRVKEFFKRAHS